MDEDLYLKARLDENRSLCISSISRKTFEECGAEFFPNDRGFFIYEQDDRATGGISILAKVASLDAAYRIVDLVGGIMPISASNQPISG
jgi:hypothetical protein